METGDQLIATEAPSDVPEGASITVLVRQLLSDGEHLARTELALARAQLTDQISALIPGLLAILFGSIFALASLFTLLAALIGWLEPTLGAGNAALVVTLGTAAIGAICIALGVRHINQRSTLRADRIEETE